jgi:hypothetical protein
LITYHSVHPHDIINISLLNKQGISEKAVKFYSEGLSIQAIANKLRSPKSTIRNHLVKAGVVIRSHSNNQVQDRIYPRKRSIKTAPYGYCLVNGKLFPDPKEQNILQLIISYWQQGLSHCAIAKLLNQKKIKPRKANEWSQPTIGFIIKRHQENNQQEKNNG